MKLYFPATPACYEQLKIAIGNGSAIAFTGAGTSTPLYPTWTRFLKDLINEARREGLHEKANLREIEKLIPTDPLEVATYLEEIFTPHRFRGRLVAIFEPQRNATESHSLIVDLPLKAIVTLNYDNGLETAFSASKRAAPMSITAHERAQVARWQQGHLFGADKLPILHWHGTPSHPETMVITGDDYNIFYNNHENVAFIGRLWRADNLLVIGFGFSDPFLVRVAENTLRTLPTDNHHFALIGVPSETQVTPLLRRQFTRKYRLTPVFYQIRSDASGNDEHTDLIKLLSALSADVTAALPSSALFSPPLVTRTNNIPPEITIHSGYSDFERDLLVSPAGRTLYVQPRLLRPLELSESTTEPTYEAIAVENIITSNASFVITTRPEYGSTTLCRRIVNDMRALNIDAVYRDANLLPNYKLKLRQEFDLEKAELSHSPQVLVLDDFDSNRHERLLKELVGLQHFTRILLVLRSSGADTATALTDGSFGILFEPLVLTHLDISDIRVLAADLFDTSDGDFVSAIVEKVYRDLLSLCIPLTPGNVIMYLTILFKEGDFSPLNRVQIVDRYIQELLRRPSDAYQDAFNAKNKMDLVSAFVYARYTAG